MSIESKVIQVITEVVGAQATINSTKESLGMDSLNEIECLMALEDEFDIEISDFEGELLTSVRQVVDYVESENF